MSDGDMRRELEAERDALAAQVEALRTIIKDFAEHGTRHDPHPTISGNPERAKGVLLAYIANMDNYIRQAALNVLALTPDAALAAHDARVRAEAFERKYHEILLAVERKFPGESRHDTALRYIREAEKNSDCADCAAAEREKGGA